jgi:hypothetical protein
MLWSDAGAFSFRKGAFGMAKKSRNDRYVPTRQEEALAATDRAARQIMRTETEARLSLTANLKARRLQKEAEEQHASGRPRSAR